jgi:3-hydroxyisobutyrate dehydrogenase-like beta-hydroxyacid dehydrogenase
VKIKKLVEGVGAVYLTTPVFGQPAAARAKQLVCVNSGIYDGRKIVAPMLKAIGKHTIDVGDDNAKGEDYRAAWMTSVLIRWI